MQEKINKQKKEGIHFTPTKLANFVAYKMISLHPISIDCKKIRILDPAIGDGELIIAILSQIYNNHNIEITVVGFDINSDSLILAEKRILSLFPNINLFLYNKDYLDEITDNNDLFSHVKKDTSFDYIIANPPYVRTQVLGADKSQKLAKKWGLKGRLDLYQAFMLAIENNMNENSIAGFITSNRFLSIEGCKDFRKRLNSSFSFFDLWDFGDTSLFKASVLPLVSIFSKKKKRQLTNFSSIYKIYNTSSFNNDIIHVTDPIDGIEKEGILQDSSGTYYLSSRGFLNFSTSSSPWTMQNTETQNWLNLVKNNTYYCFKDVGKVRVGVKTTADNVFIHDNWMQETGCEPELLLPLINHNVAEQYRRTTDITTKILYPHYYINGERGVYNIDNFPISRKYLSFHREQLEKRKYLKDAGRKWYEIWVPQKAELWSQEKIVFRDISEHPTFWLEQGTSVINGDCYWMILDSIYFPKDIIWLILAIANSSFIEKYYDCCFNNKLYSNKRRFISQYVENFPIPQYNTEISNKIIYESQDIFKNGITLEKKNRIDYHVNQAFGINL